MGLARTVRDIVYGRGRGVMRQDILELARRSRLSSYLPWVAYDPDTRLYHNADGTAGFIFECVPLPFMGEKSCTTLEALFRLGLPEDSVMQFIFYADPDIEHYLEGYLSLKGRELPVLQKVMRRYTEYFLRGTRGMEAFARMPLRSFRLFVTLKIPAEGIGKVNLKDLYSNVRENLSGAGLGPVEMPPESLVAWMRAFFNTHRPPDPGCYDPSRPLRDQVLFAETVVRKDMNAIRMGDRVLRCITVKNYPAQVNPFQTNELFGGVWGGAADASQMLTPFLFTLNVVFRDLKALIHGKANLILQQQGFGSFAPALMRKKDEYLAATDEVEKGTPYVKIIPVLWAWGPDEESAAESIMRARRLWEQQGYIMQEDRGILPVLLLASLPFGLYTAGRAVEALDRDFIVPADVAVRVLPVQADFRGGGRPQLLFVGRKGQPCPLDLFAKEANNHNCFIAAGSGAGKSFLINYITCNYFAAGAMVRIIDIGGSYKKMTTLFDARFLDFTQDSELCLNPFTNVREPVSDLPVISALVMQMCYSATDTVPPDRAELGMSLVKLAVGWAWEQFGPFADIDRVFEYLDTFPEHYRGAGGNGEARAETARFVEIAREMAFNLRDFTTQGIYGRWFNGRCNFDISRDEFVVLELEHLKPQKELFKVVTMQVINAVTQDLYLSDRSRNRLIIFDEAWQFIRDGSALKDVIEEGYRRARKYGGSFSIVTQSILDLKQFGSVGDVIRANSAFKFYLESADFDRAKTEKLLDYEEFGMALLRSVKSRRPRYSEIFLETPFGAGPTRLAVDPHSYYLYTSDAGEIAEIGRLVKEGMSYDEAIDEMAQRRTKG